MSSNTGYISLAVIGAVIVGLIGGGIYYAHGTGADTSLTPTGMSYYSRASSGNSSGYYGGKKTHRKKHSNKRTRRT